MVALAASAGGLDALTAVLSGLPADLAVPVLALEHLLPDHRSVLPQILARRTRLEVKGAEDGERLRPGFVYVAPPDAHTVVDSDGSLRLERSPPVRFVRPSVDLLFESLARVFGAHALVVVLTGAGSDGAAGVRAVKDAGGTIIAQDEESSAHFGMPGAAIATGAVDLILPLDNISAAIVGMVSVRGVA